MELEQFRQYAYNKMADAMIKALQDSADSMMRGDEPPRPDFSVKDSEDAANMILERFQSARTNSEIVTAALEIGVRWPVFARTAFDLGIYNGGRARIDEARAALNQRRSISPNTGPTTKLAKYCSQCGEEIPTGSKFCNQCGARLD